MELKEYLKEMCKKIDNNDEGKDDLLAIYVTDKINFRYHDNCFVDFHEDFCIFYDKASETSMVIPYDKIAVIQYVEKRVYMKQAKEMLIETMFKELMDD